MEPARTFGRWVTAAAALATLSFPPSSPATEPPEVGVAMAGTLKPELMRKLSPDAKLRLSEGAAEAGSDLSVLIRTDRPISDALADELRRRGARVRTVAGDVATATVPADALADVLALDAVLAVELSRPLQTE